MLEHVATFVHSAPLYERVLPEDLAHRLAQALQGAGYTVHRDDEGLLVPGASPEQVGVVAGDAGVYLIGLAPKARSLEQAFFALTGDAA